MSKRTKTATGNPPKAQRSAPKRKSSHSGGSKKRKKSAPVKPEQDWELKRPNAAGIDIGSREHWIALPKGRAERSTRRFGATTPELKKAIEWLLECGIEDVAMESTGMYWMPLYEMLEEAGIRVILADARVTRNVCGRKSDQSDCEWIQQLHSYGMLNAAFRPEDAICRLRTLRRHQKALVEQSSMHTLHIQKALDGMNLHLHHVLSNVTGTSALAMLNAIVQGERDPKKLAKMADWRVRKSAAEIEAALTGNYRHEELFVLKQALESYHYCQRQIADCEVEILKQLQAISEQCPSEADRAQSESSPKADQQGQTKTHPAVDASNGRRPRKRTEQEQTMAVLMERILGVDLTAIPGLGILVVLTLLSEVGHDMSRWRNAKAFCSWLGLSPNHKISGGRVLSSRTRRVVNRAATALRMAALAVGKTDTPLGCFYRRKAAQFGAPKAITATARKIATLIYTMISTKTAYKVIAATEYQRRYDLHRIQALHKRAEQLGFELTKIPKDP
jgi:transposase